LLLQFKLFQARDDIGIMHTILGSITLESWIPKTKIREVQGDTKRKKEKLFLCFLP